MRVSPHSYWSPLTPIDNPCVSTFLVGNKKNIRRLVCFISLQVSAQKNINESITSFSLTPVCFLIIKLHMIWMHLCGYKRILGAVHPDLSCHLKSSSGLRCRTPGTKRPGRSSSAGPVILRTAEFGATKHTYTELCHNSCRKAVCVCPFIIMHTLAHTPASTTP